METTKNADLPQSIVCVVVYVFVFGIIDLVMFDGIAFDSIARWIDVSLSK